MSALILKLFKITLDDIFSYCQSLLVERVPRGFALFYGLAIANVKQAFLDISYRLSFCHSNVYCVLRHHFPKCPIV